MRRACERGLKTFDYGRSKSGHRVVLVQEELGLRAAAAPLRVSSLIAAMPFRRTIRRIRSTARSSGSGAGCREALPTGSDRTSSAISGEVHVTRHSFPVVAAFPLEHDARSNPQRPRTGARLPVERDAARMARRGGGSRVRAGVDRLRLLADRRGDGRHLDALRTRSRTVSSVAPDFRMARLARARRRCLQVAPQPGWWVLVPLAAAGAGWLLGELGTGQRGVAVRVRGDARAGGADGHRHAGCPRASPFRSPSCSSRCPRASS